MVELLLVILAIALFIAGIYLGIDIVFDAMKQAHVNENTIRIIKEIIYINLIKNSYDNKYVYYECNWWMYCNPSWR